MTAAQQLAALTEHDLQLVRSGVPEQHVEQREALLAQADPREDAFRRAYAAQALISAALTEQRDRVSAQLKALAPGRAAVQAYARSAQA